METAIQNLIHDDKSILIALSVIEKMCVNVQNNNKQTDYKDIEDIIGFLQVLADKCHHVKEEDFLFPALEKVGIKKENGPIGVMLSQHKQGHELIKQMQESVVNKIINRNAFVDTASSYVNLLRNHIEKEDTLLFPLSDTKLSASKQKELLKNFENLEKNVIGEGKYEELYILLVKFKGKYLK